MKKEENIELGIKHCIAGEQLGTLIQYKRNFDYFDEIYYRIIEFYNREISHVFLADAAKEIEYVNLTEDSWY